MVDRLRTEGYRLTPQRQLVWDVLRRADDHLTAEQIHAQITEQAPQVNLASVYRSLSLLAELGLAREVQLGEGMGRWELNHPDDAFHLVCRTCGGVEHHPGDLVERVRAHLAGEHGFTPEHVDLVVHGVCASCDTAGLARRGPER
jgi:Fur family ferric uptake transcriptional regulator